ncbi:MAG: transposase [Planctomycetota bacterium]|jgi:transposase-like protein
MARASKFTDEQKLEIALELLAGKLSHAEICRTWDISSLPGQEGTWRPAPLR